MPKINLGNSTAFLVSDNETKKKVINYLYKNVELNKFRFKMLDNLSKLDELKNNPHYVSPNFRGVNYLLICMKIQEQNKTFIIDRRKLKYYKNNLNLKEIKIIEIKIHADPVLFTGSIFDGKMIDKKYFLVFDCYVLFGKENISQEMKTKYFTLDKIFSTHFDNNPCLNFQIKINKLYEYEELDKLINEVIPNTSLSTSGIVFFPKYSGILVIFNESKKEKEIVNYNSTSDYSNNLQYNNTLNNSENKITNNELSNVSSDYDMIRDLSNYLSERTYNYENFNIKKTFILTKTDIPDVYTLKDTNNIKIGIAHIPSLKISHRVKEWLKNKKYTQAECVYHKQFDKWIPIKNL